MPSPIVIPFDNNPVSVSVKTASYTIPGGKFAFVETASPYFSINGVFLHPSYTLSISQTAGASTVYTRVNVPHGCFVTTATLSASSSTGLTTRAGYVYSGNVSAGDADLIASATRASNGTSTILTNFSMPVTEFTIGVNNTSTGTYTTSITYYYFMASPRGKWVPSGTVLNGNNYTVTEYNQIS